MSNLDNAVRELVSIVQTTVEQKCAPALSQLVVAMQACRPGERGPAGPPGAKGDKGDPGDPQVLRQMIREAVHAQLGAFITAHGLELEYQRIALTRQMLSLELDHLEKDGDSRRRDQLSAEIGVLNGKLELLSRQLASARDRMAKCA
jgi:hypothetical protein